MEWLPIKATFDELNEFLLLIIVTWPLLILADHSMTHKFTFAPLLFFCLILLFTWLGLNNYLTHPAPDGGVALLVLVLSLFLLVDFTKLISFEKQFLFFFVLVLCSTIASIKLSGVVFALLPAILFLFRVFKEKKHNNRRLLIFSLVIAGLINGIQVYRSVILSGFLAFPIAQTKIATVAWALPNNVANNELSFIRSFARYGRFADFSQHFPDLEKSQLLELYDSPSFDIHLWLETQVDPLKIALLILVFIGLIYLFFEATHSRSDVLLVYAFVLLTSILIWFFKAPSFRFIYGSLFSVILLFAGTLIARKRMVYWEVHRHLAYVVLLSFAFFIAFDLRYKPSLTEFKVLPSAFIVPSTKEYSHMGFKVYYSEEEKVDINSKVETRTDQCWDAPIPCATGVNRNFLFRGKDLSAGFLPKKNAASSNDTASGIE